MPDVIANERASDLDEMNRCASRFRCASENSKTIQFAVDKVVFRTQIVCSRVGLISWPDDKHYTTGRRRENKTKCIFLVKLK